MRSQLKNDPQKVNQLLENHLEKLQDKNEQFFENVLLGQKNQKLTIKQDYKKGEETTYINSFMKNQQMNERYQSVPTSHLYKDFRIKFPMDLKTNYSQDFMKKQKIENFNTAHHNKGFNSYIPFGETSSYRNQFLNWGYQKSVAFENDRMKKTILDKMPFKSTSIYADSFKGHQSTNDFESDRMLNNQQCILRPLFKNPIAPIVPFMSITTNMNSYKSNTVQKAKLIKQPQQSHINQDVKNQYLSTQRQDYIKNDLKDTYDSKIKQQYNEQVKKLLRRHKQQQQQL